MSKAKPTLPFVVLAAAVAAARAPGAVVAISCSPTSDRGIPSLQVAGRMASMRTARFSSDMIEVNAVGGKQSMKQVPGALLGADSSVEVERMQVELWRNMPAAEKARAVGQVSRSVRELSMAGIRSRHPLASEKECSLRYAVLTLGRSLACQAYPEAGRKP